MSTPPNWKTDYILGYDQIVQAYKAADLAKKTLDDNGWGWEDKKHPSTYDIYMTFLREAIDLNALGAEVGTTQAQGRLMTEVINVDEEQRRIDYIFYVELGDTY